MVEVNNKKSKLSTTQKILIVGFVLVLIAIGVVGYFIYRTLLPEQIEEADTSTSYLIDESNLEEVTDDINSIVQDSMFEINMNNSWRFPDGSTASSNARIANSSSNKYPIAFEIIIEGEEEPVYVSTIIPVGSQLSQLVLEKDLPAGEYYAVCMYHILNENGTTKYSTGVEVRLVIEK